MQGLSDFPRELWPPVGIVHTAFDVMVGAGSVMFALAVVGAWLLFRKRNIYEHRPFLFMATLCAPLGLIAVEAGWIVTEVGRQPWIIYGVMQVKDALTPMPGLVFSLVGSLVLYLALGVIVVVLLWRHALSAPTDAPDDDTAQADARSTPGPSGSLP